MSQHRKPRDGSGKQLDSSGQIGNKSKLKGGLIGSDQSGPKSEHGERGPVSQSIGSSGSSEKVPSYRAPSTGSNHETPEVDNVDTFWTKLKNQLNCFVSRIIKHWKIAVFLLLSLIIVLFTGLFFYDFLFLRPFNLNRNQNPVPESLAMFGGIPVDPVEIEQRPEYENLAAVFRFEWRGDQPFLSWLVNDTDSDPIPLSLEVRGATLLIGPPDVDEGHDFNATRSSVRNIRALWDESYTGSEGRSFVPSPERVKGGFSIDFPKRHSIDEKDIHMVLTDEEWKEKVEEFEQQENEDPYGWGRLSDRDSAFSKAVVAVLGSSAEGVRRSELPSRGVVILKPSGPNKRSSEISLSVAEYHTPIFEWKRTRNLDSAPVRIEIVDPVPMKIFRRARVSSDRDLTKTAKGFLQSKAESVRPEGTLELLESDAFESHFYAYSDLLVLSHQSTELGRDQLLTLMSNWHTNHTNGKSIEEAGKKLRERSIGKFSIGSPLHKYQYSYSYCYYALCCLVLGELADIAYGETKEEKYNDLGKTAARMLRFSVDDVCGSILNENMEDRMKLGYQGKDRSVYLLLHYLLNKFKMRQAAGSQHLIQKIPELNEALSIVEDYILNPGPQFDAGKVPETEYRAGSGLSEYLFPGWLMAKGIESNALEVKQLFDGDHDYLTRWESYLNSTTKDFWSKKAVKGQNNYRYWYGIAYGARLFELSKLYKTAAVGVDAPAPLETWKTLVKLALEEKMKTPSETNKNDYVENFFLISLETMVDAE